MVPSYRADRFVNYSSDRIDRLTTKNRDFSIFQRNEQF